MSYVACDLCVWIGEVGAEESKSFNFSARYETFMGQLSLRSYHFTTVSNSLSSISLFEKFHPLVYRRKKKNRFYQIQCYHYYLSVVDIFLHKENKQKNP